jgi:NAD(P)-dependent dehydrogenase (short-subunit alcohol dehydrogenase family)
VSDFAERVAIVTGGASGIGRALCEALAAEGAVVVVADRNGEGARAVAERLAGSGLRARAEAVDVADAEAVRKLVEETVAREGRLDLLFNNAGIAIGGEVRDMTVEHWRRIVDVNLWGVVNGVRAAYPLMVRQGSGHIVNTASGAGLVPSPLSTAYAMTKHAVVGLSTSLRMEAAGLGVRVSVVCPGFVDTAIFDSAVVAKGPPVRELSDRAPVRPYPAPKAAQAILRGVRRNRAVIVFPFHMHAMRWMVRLAPWLVRRMAARQVAEFRRLAHPHRGELGS